MVKSGRSGAYASVGGARAACIVGVGETEYRRWGGFTDRSELSLACEAVLNALADAGLSAGDVDGLTSYGGDANEPSRLQDALGLTEVRFASMVWGGGGTGSCGGLMQAAIAVESGAADVVVVLRALCQGQSRRYGQFNPARPGNNFLAPFGMLSPPSMIAPLVQRYMHLHGVTPEQMAHVALSARMNAHRNPNAVMRGRPLDMDSYLAARMIADPLRLFDCCQENDGACAVIVTSLDRARDLPHKAVRVLSSGQGSNPGWGTGALGGHNMPDDEYARGNASRLARELYSAAGIVARNVDVAQIYDHFSGLVLMSLENFGFCDRGGGGDFVAAGNIYRDGGSLPINTSGGHLSEAYIHGMNLIAEGVRQMRGQSMAQVADARICLVTGGLAGPPATAVILGAD